MDDDFTDGMVHRVFGEHLAIFSRLHGRESHQMVWGPFVLDNCAAVRVPGNSPLQGIERFFNANVFCD